MSAFINFSFASLTSKIEFSLYFLEEIKKKQRKKSFILLDTSACDNKIFL